MKTHGIISEPPSYQSPKPLNWINTNQKILSGCTGRDNTFNNRINKDALSLSPNFLSRFQREQPQIITNKRLIPMKHKKMEELKYQEKDKRLSDRQDFMKDRRPDINIFQEEVKQDINTKEMKVLIGKPRKYYNPRNLIVGDGTHIGTGNVMEKKLSFTTNTQKTKNTKLYSNTSRLNQTFEITARVFPKVCMLKTREQFMSQDKFVNSYNEKMKVFSRGTKLQSWCKYQKSIRSRTTKENFNEKNNESITKFKDDVDSNMTFMESKNDNENKNRKNTEENLTYTQKKKNIPQKPVQNVKIFDYDSNKQHDLVVAEEENNDFEKILFTSMLADQTNSDGHKTDRNINNENKNKKIVTDVYYPPLKLKYMDISFGVNKDNKTDGLKYCSKRSKDIAAEKNKTIHPFAKDEITKSSIEERLNIRKQNEEKGKEKLDFCRQTFCGNRREPTFREQCLLNKQRKKDYSREIQEDMNQDNYYQQVFTQIVDLSKSKKKKWINVNLDLTI